MKPIHKQIVTDENNRPVAVQIPYEEWLDIEQLLNVQPESSSKDISRFAGTLRWDEDGVDYQRRVREEWTR